MTPPGLTFMDLQMRWVLSVADIFDIPGDALVN